MAPELKTAGELDVEIAGQVVDELQRARLKFPKFLASRHEGIAVLREEYLEAEELVFHGPRDPVGNEALKTELIQTAAMAIRMIVDLQL